MLINPSVKTAPLLNAIGPMMALEDARKLGQARPLFSWHCSYYLERRQKILVFANDATAALIVLRGINAAQRREVPGAFLQGIHLLGQLAGVSPEQTQVCLKAAGALQTGRNFNRSSMGAVANASLMLQWTEVTSGDLLDAAAMNSINDVPMRGTFPKGEWAKALGQLQA